MFNLGLNTHLIYADPGPSPTKEYDVVLLKNIDPATDATRIYVDLERLGYRVHSIRNATTSVTRRPVPMFLVELLKSPFNANILGMIRIANQNVFVEKYYCSPELLRCIICQGLDHKADDCSSFPICAWCSGPHLTMHCTVNRDFPPTCCRCGGRHPSNYKGCHVYRQRLLEAKMEMLRKGAEINMPTEELIRLALEEEQVMNQCEGFQYGSSSNDIPFGMDKNVVSSVLDTMVYSQKMIQADYLREVLKFTVDHYLSMHHEWRDRLLKEEVEEEEESL